VPAELDHKDAPEEGTDQEPDEGGQGCQQREAWSMGERESNEDDIAGHIGDEHATQAEDAHGVDESAHRGEYQQQRRQGPVPRISEEACPEGGLTP
jgi:hypothetical protein